MTIGEISARLIDALSGWQYTTYHPKSSTSVYFHINGVGTASVRDHMPKKSALPRLRYNLVIGYHGKRVFRVNGGKCFFYNEDEVDEFVRDVVDARRRVRHTF